MPKLDLILMQPWDPASSLQRTLGTEGPVKGTTRGVPDPEGGLFPGLLCKSVSRGKRRLGREIVLDEKRFKGPTAKCNGSL